MTTVNIDLSTGAPPSPERTLKLAETLAEIMRVLNHTTMHHEAIGKPSDVDRVVRDLSSMEARLPQLLGQLGAWLEQEEATGRIEVAGQAEDPAVSVMAVVMNLEDASGAAARAQVDLDVAASVTSSLEGREDSK